MSFDVDDDTLMKQWIMACVDLSNGCLALPYISRPMLDCWAVSCPIYNL